jgi:hypothetical protein
LVAAQPLEAIHTFEGTETMTAAIVGRDITGVGAFTCQMGEDKRMAVVYDRT